MCIHQGKWRNEFAPYSNRIQTLTCGPAREQPSSRGWEGACTPLTEVMQLQGLGGQMQNGHRRKLDGLSD